MRRAGMLRKAVLAGAFSLAIASPVLADTFVNGHFRRDGTYVQPYWRSNPDSIPQNNFSYPGNLNPYTEKLAPGGSSRWGGLNGSPQRTPGYAPYGSRLFNIK